MTAETPLLELDIQEILSIEIETDHRRRMIKDGDIKMIPKFYPLSEMSYDELFEQIKSGDWDTPEKMGLVRELRVRYNMVCKNP